MAFEQRDNSGVLFRNEDKTEDKHPNAKGSAMIDGVEYWVSAWTRATKNGDKFQSLSFRRKDEKPAKREHGLGGAADMDSDVPF